MVSSRIIRAARRVAAFELPIILAIAPALMFPSPQRIAVLAAVPLVWFCAWRSTGRVVPRTPLNAPLFWLLAMVAASTFATADLRFSLGRIAGVLLGALLFWAIARWLTSDARLKVAALAFLAAGAALAVVALFGTIWVLKHPVLNVVIVGLPQLIRGLPGAEDGFNTNAVAGCLVLFVPAQVALLAGGADAWWAARARSAIARGLIRTAAIALQTVLLVLTAGTTVLMQSSTAWVALGASAAAFLVWYRRWTRVALAGVAAASLIVLAAAGPDRVFARVFTRAGAEATSIVESRVDVWRRAVLGIRDHPIAGMGMNMFRKVAPTAYPAEAHAPADIVHAHNNFLQTALDLGLPGLVAYTALWGLTAAALIRTYRASDHRVYRALAGGLGAGLLAHLVFGLADAVPLGAKAGVLFWLTLGIALGVCQVVGAGRPARYDTASQTSGA